MKLKAVRLSICLAAMVGLLLAGIWGALVREQRPVAPEPIALDFRVPVLGNDPRLIVPPLGARSQDPFVKLKAAYDNDIQIFSFFIGMER